MAEFHSDHRADADPGTDERHQRRRDQRGFSGAVLAGDDRSPTGLTAPLTMRGVPRNVAIAASASAPGYWIATINNGVQSNPPCPDNGVTCFTNDGGTGAGSPIWAGISRLIAQSLNTTRLGNIDPQLYQLAAAGSPGLVDVSQIGDNCTLGTCSVYPGYQVGPGYDWGTGLVIRTSKP